MPVEEIAEALGVSPVVAGVPLPGPPPRFNVAPTQSMLVLRAAAAVGASAQRELAWLRWGLVPFWAKDSKIGSRFLQARAETVDTTPAYRQSFTEKRAVVIVDGFYEWSHASEGAKTKATKQAAKIPHLLRPAGGGLLAIAGLWERWRPPSGAPVESCAVLTIAAGPRVWALHDRMPLLLRPHELEPWLHGSSADATAITRGGAESALGPRDEGLVLTRVSTWVNDVRHDDAACIAPAHSV